LENLVAPVQPGLAAPEDGRTPLSSILRPWQYVEPLRRVRPDWPEQVIPGAGHLNCLLKPEFEQELEKALEKNAPTTK